jgi:two-component system sensor histidine kinase MprB
MTLTGRLTLGFAALGVIVSAVVGGLAFAATDHGLDEQTRLTLMDAAASLAAGQVPDGLSGMIPPDGHPLDRHGDALLLAQRLSPAGVATGIQGLPAQLPATAADQAIAQTPSDHSAVFCYVEVSGAPYLMLTRSLGHGRGAVQVARELDATHAVLDRLASTLIVLAVVVAAAAAVAGLFLARALTRRLVRLTAAAEQVSATGRLDVEVSGHGRDEVGRLGTAFDAMLGRLARSKDDQQRLVQNAGHELRTPLTSIRTNVSLLRRAGELSEQERSAILDDLTSETRELTDLVNELVELATDRRADEPESTVDLGELAGQVAQRARRRSGRLVTVAVPGAEPGRPGSDAGPMVRGRPQGLERAVSNLVDNAIKFDPDGREPVEIVLVARLDGVRVEVRDRGPGVPEEDLDRIFDRFHRATSVRSLSGSGLGLSIVQEVATEHGGAVFATPRDDRGVVMGFTLSADRLQTGSYPD